MRFSVRLSSGVGLEEFREAATACESYGFDQIWTGNDLLRRSGIVPVVLALDATSRIEVGSSVLNPVALHPAEIAMLTANLQELSGGRYVLGLGAGSEVFLRWAGLEPGTPVARTRAGLRAVRGLLGGRNPEGWHDRAVLRDGPARPTRIYLGAMGPRMLALAGREGDGVLALCLPPDRFGWFREQVGPVTPDFDLVCCLWCSVDDDPAAARARLAPKVAAYAGSLAPATLQAGGFDVERFAHVAGLVERGEEAAAVAAVDEDMLRLGLVGTAHQVADRCRELAAAGATHLSFGQPLGRTSREAVQLLGTRVLPSLRDLRGAA
ncbi:LLM class flavin-dependent oxidoreductase [Kineococcus sp. SYSU DK003]|uniref:LLM class flavin-dependent oxidoreductase n=1 Tax=Kineococcus sp. SYSU DK003 TaxID=3383124 RepID=UPI003D7D1461